MVSPRIIAAELAPEHIRNDCQFRCAKLPGGGLPTPTVKIFLIFQKHNSGLKRELSPPVGSLVDFHDVADDQRLVDVQFEMLENVTARSGFSIDRFADRLGATAMTAGLMTIRSSNGPEETMNRFEAEVKKRGMTVFARIDHAAGAATAGMSLRPTELMIFGNARVGTPLMQAAQTMGIDLPLKVLVWKDEAGVIWLSYTDPACLVERHGLDSESAPSVRQMTVALADIAQKAAVAG